jgi:hypothetical protein
MSDKAVWETVQSGASLARTLDRLDRGVGEEFADAVG